MAHGGFSWLPFPNLTAFPSLTTRSASSLRAYGILGVPVAEARLMLSGTIATVYDFDIDELRPIADRVGPSPERILTPSAAFQTAGSTLRSGSAIHAFISPRVMRTRPQAVYSQIAPSLSSIDQ